MFSFKLLKFVLFLYNSKVFSCNLLASLIASAKKSTFSSLLLSSLFIFFNTTPNVFFGVWDSFFFPCFIFWFWIFLLFVLFWEYEFDLFIWLSNSYCFSNSDNFSFNDLFSFFNFEIWTSWFFIDNCNFYQSFIAPCFD